MTTVGPIGRTLRCAVTAGALSLIGCTSERLAPAEQTQVLDNPECQRMRDKLATDQTLTPVQAAEITKDMETIGCGRALHRR